MANPDSTDVVLRRSGDDATAKTAAAVAAAIAAGAGPGEVPVPVDHLELTPHNAASFKKKLRVYAFPVDAPVVVHKPWGDSTAMPNDYFVIEGVDDVYTCKQDVFRASYEPVSGERNVYQKVRPILARRMSRSFVAKNSAGDQYGSPGRFLVQVGCSASESLTLPMGAQGSHCALPFCAQAPDGDQYVVDPGVFVNSYERNVVRRSSRELVGVVDAVIEHGIAIIERAQARCVNAMLLLELLSLLLLLRTLAAVM